MRRTVKSNNTQQQQQQKSTKTHQSLSTVSFTSNMSRGTFKVIAKISNHSCRVFEEGHDRYIPASMITMVEKQSTLFEEMNYGNIETLHKALVLDGYLKCDTDHVGICLDTLGLYIITINGNRDYVVDPSENEHMERFLAGTDDPLYDLVHELRYNPKIRLGEDVQEAESHFKKQKI